MQQVLTQVPARVLKGGEGGSAHFDDHYMFDVRRMVRLGKVVMDAGKMFSERA